MIAFGVVLMIVGVLMTAGGFFYDTSVASIGGSGRTHNIGLIAMQEVLIISGAGALVSGSVFVGAGAIVDRLQKLLDDSWRPSDGDTIKDPKPIAGATDPATHLPGGDDIEQIGGWFQQNYGKKPSATQALRLLGARRQGRLLEEVARVNAELDT